MFESKLVGHKAYQCFPSCCASLLKKPQDYYPYKLQVSFQFRTCFPLLSYPVIFVYHCFSLGSISVFQVCSLDPFWLPGEERGEDSVELDQEDGT